MEYAFPPSPPMAAQSTLMFAALIGATLLGLLFFWRNRTAAWPIWVFLVSLCAGWILAAAATGYGEGTYSFPLFSVINTAICGFGLIWGFVRFPKEFVAAISILIALCVFFAVLTPATSSPHRAARRMQCMSHLHNVMVALHNYASVHDGRMPPAGSSLEDLSWRVKILPLIDESALYRAYQRDQPWNSPANDEFAKYWIKSYSCPSNPTAKDAQSRFYSAYALLTGNATAFDGPNSLTLDEIGMAGGLSNTVILGEACGANIVWNELRDINTAAQPAGVNLPGKTWGTSGGWLSTYHKEIANVAFADGSVKSISTNIDPAVLKALSTVDPADNPKDGRIP